MGQSREILEHIRGFVPDKRTFLYLNLQPQTEAPLLSKERGSKVKIVYAGLFGVAQDMLSLLKSVDFTSLGVEMHLYGGGNQIDDILAYISGGDKNIWYHGYVSKLQMNKELHRYDLSIIPLAAHIYGAVPSKIYDLLPAGIPVLFSGGGEGARVVTENGFGLVSKHGDYASLARNIKAFVEMPAEEYSRYTANCLGAAAGEYSFSKQMEKFVKFLGE